MSDVAWWFFDPRLKNPAIRGHSVGFGVDCRCRGVRFEGCTVAGKPLKAPADADVQINDCVDDVTFE